MNRFYKLSGITLLISCVLIGGCVTSPYDGQVIGDSISDSFVAGGWVQHPNRLIRIQVRKSANHPWVQIGTTYSSTAPVEFDGQTFYRWERSVVVPAAHWTQYVTLSNPPQPSHSTTLLRALMGTTVLTTFDTGIENIIFNDPNATIESLIEDHAAGNSVTVVAVPG